jgi:hypothetical protein
MNTTTVDMTGTAPPVQAAMVPIPRSVPPGLFDIPGCEFSKVGLAIKPGLRFDLWLRLVGLLVSAGKGIQFWIGDAIIYGEQQAYGERYSQAIQTTGCEYQYLADAVYAARSVKFSLRNENLSFNHHKAVAPLAPSQQKRWLAMAEKKGWDYRKLRKMIAGAKALTRLGRNRSIDKNTMAHIDRTIEIIETQIIPDCPDPELKARVYDELLEDLRFERSERAVIDLQESILTNWKNGSKTTSALTKIMKVSASEVTEILGVRLGWYKVREAKRHDGQKGEREWVWTPPGQPTGDAYAGAKPASNYENKNPQSD